MSDLSLGASANVFIDAGQVVRVSTSGVATVVMQYGGPGGTTTITANTADFGPYGVPAKIRITATSGTVNYREMDEDPGFSQSEASALRGLVSGAWILEGATAGQSTAWLPLIGGGFRLAYALDSGTTATTFSVDISADGSTSLGQAFTGSYASSTAFEDTGQRLVSNVNATHFRFNVLSGGPLSVKRLA